MVPGDLLELRPEDANLAIRLIDALARLGIDLDETDAIQITRELNGVWEPAL